MGGATPQQFHGPQDRPEQAAEPSEDGCLIEEAHTDQNAFAELYRRHYDGVFRHCVRRLFDRAIAEDVTSNVFLRIAQAFDRFQGDEKDFRNWLYKIATNEINAYQRSRTRRARLFRRAATERHSQRQQARMDDTGQEGAAILWRALQSLRPRYQAIVALRYFENMEFADIAAILDSSASTVRSQLSRALAKLRQQCDEVGRQPGEGE
ncbi:MAG TPA: sigma-70 family RNA polymerase sigma factor [Phycisphaerae bacterium]|nr:sigma-70 family RNA polymerase sigma factor [Phycisphaerae bacterium]